MSWGLEELARFGLSILGVLLVSAALLVCLPHLRLSRWMKVLAVGLAGVLAVRVTSLTLPFYLRFMEAQFGTSWLQEILLMAHACDVAAWGILVLGLWGLFRDLRDQFERHRIEVLRLTPDRRDGE
jgi:hypothetical protein